MNVWVSVFVWSCGFHFSWFMPRNGLAGPNDNSAYCQTVSQGDFAILHPTKKVYEFQFLPTLANVCWDLIFFPSFYFTVAFSCPHEHRFRWFTKCSVSVGVPLLNHSLKVEALDLAQFRTVVNRGTWIITTQSFSPLVSFLDVRSKANNWCTQVWYGFSDHSAQKWPVCKMLPAELVPASLPTASVNRRICCLTKEN